MDFLWFFKFLEILCEFLLSFFFCDNIGLVFRKLVVFFVYKLDDDVIVLFSWLLLFLVIDILRFFFIVLVLVCLIGIKLILLFICFFFFRVCKEFVW